ncbi:MAG: cobalamin B12-binding domain-containing protein [Pseudomonadota bacterium]
MRNATRSQSSMEGPLGAMSGAESAPPCAPTLYALIAEEIVPALVNRTGQSPRKRTHRHGTLTTADHAALAAALLEGAETKPEKIIASWDRSGVATSVIVLEGIAGAARTLGEQWCEDTLSFMDVTLAMGRLEALVNTIEPRNEEHPLRLGLNAARHRGERVPSILIAAAPGEQHTFPGRLLAWLFDAEGWDTAFIAETVTPKSLRKHITTNRSDVVALSLSSDRFLPQLQETVAELKASSATKSCAIMVGGKTFLDDPRAAIRVGADGWAINARSAVDTALRLRRDRS